MWLSYNDKYEVSIEGEVRDKKTGRILKGCVIQGYKRHGFKIDGKQKMVYLHHIIASLFLPAPTEPNCVIDHYDRNRLNNHPSNLRWVSRSMNSINRTVQTKTNANKKEGHHHIVYVNYYKVAIDHKQKRHVKTFSTLEEAIEYRDKFIDELNKVIPL
jgi:hypothetical protein